MFVLLLMNISFVFVYLIACIIANVLIGDGITGIISFFNAIIALSITIAFIIFISFVLALALANRSQVIFLTDGDTHGGIPDTTPQQRTISVISSATLSQQPVQMFFCILQFPFARDQFLRRGKHLRLSAGYAIPRRCDGGGGSGRGYFGLVRSPRAFRSSVILALLLLGSVGRHG